MALLMLAPATVHAQNINLAWDPSASPDVAGYAVNVGLAPFSPGQTFDVGPATTFTFTQAVPGTRYYFSVRAYDADNNASGPSNEVAWKINVGPRLTEVASVGSRLGVAASVQLDAVDDGDPLSYSATGLPAGLSLNTSTGRITGTPTTAGARAVSITVSDGQLTDTHAFTWVVAGPPSADSVTPDTGNGPTQTFQLNYSDPLGATASSQLWAWFSATLASSSANSCLTYYDIAASRLNLINDSGSGWLQAALGGSGTLQNSQCSVALASSSAALSGNNATVTLAVTFRGNYTGAKNVYMYAAAPGANSGWQARGSWTIPSQTAAVTADSASPSTGNGATQTFALQYSDTLGASDMATAWVWFNATLASTSANSCLAYYDRPSGRVNLLNDTGTTWTQGTVGSSGTLQNSQCAIALGTSSVAMGGSALTLNLAVTFRPSFSGGKNIFMYGASVAGRTSGWQARGTWTVPGTTLAVSADSVAPVTGSGPTQTFALQYGDTRGATDLSTAWVWFNTSLASTSANSCLAYYDRASGRVNLLNDSGTTWTNGTPGSSATLQNSQCSIAMAGSSASLSGNTLTLNLAMTFRPGYSGDKNIYLYAASVAGVNSGWQVRGTWTVPAGASGVTADSATPNTGAGRSQTFTLRYSDSTGGINLRSLWVWFNGSFAPTGANSCMIYYNRQWNEVYLINDAGTGWLRGQIPFGSLTNRSCNVNLGTSSVSVSGNTATLNLAVTFTANFLGTKNIYLFGDNLSGANSGWQPRGSWTVQ